MTTSGGRRQGTAINRTQWLVLAFFLAVWVTVITTLAVSPQIYRPGLVRAPGSLRVAEIVFVVALSGLICVISAGVVRRWRWLFWVILMVFLLGVLRVPVTVLELSGQMAASSPAWYIAVQGVASVAQFAIALLMLAGYRSSGVWGAF
jgi:hypothetical protein